MVGIQPPSSRCAPATSGASGVAEGAPLESVVIRTTLPGLGTPGQKKVNRGISNLSTAGDSPDEGAAEPSVRSAHVRVCIRLRPLLDSDLAQPRRDADSPRKLPGNAKSRTVSPSKNQRFSRQSEPTASPIRSPARAQKFEEAEKSKHLPAWRTSTSSTKVISQSAHIPPESGKSTSYMFDRVYGPDDRTSILYNESIKNIIQSVVEGYHGSVFAYGQTNSGKTHTMTGSSKEEGVVRLAVKDIFRRVREGARTASREYLMRVSYLEIYNEQIYDLLASPPAKSKLKSSRLSTSLQHHHLPPSTAVRIFESRTEGVTVRGLREEIVTCPEDVFALLDSGDARRKVGSTGLNPASSRSHSVFRLVLESRASRSAGNAPPVTPSSKSSAGSDDDSVATGRSSITHSLATTVKGPVRISSLSLVDLAGSESVKATGATGVRQKEGQYINKSLLTLGHVVHKLSEMSTKPDAISFSTKEHVPYRDSKLTRLLQPSLGGNAQVCIVCNVSPSLYNLEESHNTLKFATRAKRIQQHAKINEIADDKTLLRSYREEIEELKRQLKEAKKAASMRVNLMEKELAQLQTPVKHHDIAGEGDEHDDTQVLVSAIKNLECLILKAGASKSTRKNRAESNEPREVSLDSDEPGPSRILDSALIEAESDVSKETDEHPAALTPDANSRTLSESQSEIPFHDGDHARLVEELHRIQGMLGTVMKLRKAAPPSNTKQIPNEKHYEKPVSTPLRDAEVERLRLQLREQEVASTMRQADSSFLQGQLNQKENLLKEVSDLLVALEKRQMELETDNAKLREELTTARFLVEESETERKKLLQQLEEKESSPST